MTKKELIEALKDMPDDAIIIVASDEEGNNFREVPDGWITQGFFKEENYGNGSFNTEEDQDDKDELGTPCICIG